MDSESGQLSGSLLDAAVELMGRSGRGGTVRVRGRSMIPTLAEGQMLAVEFSPDRLSRGDLLVYRQDGLLMVHRLLGPARFPDGRPSLRTRGDGLPTFDPHLDPARVVGRVTAFRSGDEWRTTRARRSRAYARGLAWHDYFWAASAVAARGTERLLDALHLRVPLRRWIVAVDRRTMRLAHGCFFRWAHPVVPTPAEAEESDGGGETGA